MAKPASPRPARWPARSGRWRCRRRRRRSRRARRASRAAPPPPGSAPSKPGVRRRVARPCRTPPRCRATSRSGWNAAPGVPRAAVRAARCRRSPGRRRSARPGRRGGRGWRRRGRSRPSPAMCAEIAAATAAPPATASEPPSQKSFWTSTTISARMAPPESSRGQHRRDRGLAARQLQALPRHRHQAARRCSRDSLQRRQVGDRARRRASAAPAARGRAGRPRAASPPRCTTSSIAVPVGLCRRTADLRPPRDSFAALRLATGRPSTSTSL